MIDAIGLIGAVLLAVCGVPQAWLSWRLGHSHGVSAAMLALWGGGTILTAAYVLANYADAPLLLNYAINACSIGVIVRYKWWPRADH